MTEKQIEEAMNKIKKTVSEMTREQRRDYYYLASMAMNDNDVEHSVNAKQIAEKFGSASIFTFHVVMSACYDALTPGEKESDYRRAEQKLNVIAKAGEEGAIRFNENDIVSTVPLLAIRTAKGMTQQDLAKKTGISTRQISRLETGESKIQNITAANLIALADALGVDVHELTRGE